MDHVIESLYEWLRVYEVSEPENEKAFMRIKAAIGELEKYYNDDEIGDEEPLILLDGKYEFTMADYHKILHEKRLSYREKAMLMHIMINQGITYEEMVELSDDGKASIKAGMKALILKGFLIQQSNIRSRSDRYIFLDGDAPMDQRIILRKQRVDKPKQPKP